MKIYIIIPTYNRRQLLKQCLKSLNNQTCQNFQVLVVVDGSTDGTLEMLKNEYQAVDFIIGNGNWWWTKSVNEGIKNAIKENPTHILLLNDDVVLPDNYIQEIYKAIDENKTNVLINVAAKDIHTKDWSYLGLEKNWSNPLKSISYLNTYKSDPPKYIESSLLYGRGLIVPVSVFSEIGFFDEKSFPQAMADSDFSLRAKRAGYTLIITTMAYLYSHTKENDRKHFESNYSFKNFFLRLISIRSSSNLIYLLKYNYRHCPKKYFFQYSIINFVAVIGGYFLRWFKK